MIINEFTDNTQFELIPIIEEPCNTYKIVHIHNKNNTYHLTRQILINSIYTLDTYSLFYHILSKNIDDFNEEYGAFACLIHRSEIEADLYTNLDSDALDMIINYVQTNKLSNTVSEKNTIIELASIFGLPKIVSVLRKD